MFGYMPTNYKTVLNWKRIYFILLQWVKSARESTLCEILNSYFSKI